MSKYLCTTVETYRVDDEAEAKQLIEDTKANSAGILTKYTSQFKEVKSKGEVVDSYYLVQLTQTFNNPKEPDNEVSISYEV